jgi:excisionase family DNA binding protein
MGKLIYTTLNETELSKLLSDVLQPIVANEVQKVLASKNSLAQKSDEYLNRREAAALLRISTVTLTKLVKENVIKAKVLGGNYRFSKRQILEYLNVEQK